MVNINKNLNDEQYRVTQNRGTEPAFSGAYWDKKDKGNYKCIWKYANANELVE